MREAGGKFSRIVLAVSVRAEGVGARTDVIDRWQALATHRDDGVEGAEAVVVPDRENIAFTVCGDVRDQRTQLARRHIDLASETRTEVGTVGEHPLVIARGGVLPDHVQDTGGVNSQIRCNRDTAIVGDVEPRCEAGAAVG